jgi:hypothetical protein
MIKIKGRDMKLSTHLHLVRSFRMRTAVLPSLYSFETGGKPRILKRGVLYNPQVLIKPSEHKNFRSEVK